MLTAEERQAAIGVTSLWWLGVVTGILYLILGFVVLSFDTQSLLTVSILIGISFLFSALSYFIAAVLESWWFAVGGILAFIAGVVAFAYPNETLVVLGLLLGWTLLIAGILDIVGSLTNRARELWWLGLVQGIVMMVLGVWAVGEDDRSVFLVLTLTGIYCVVRGVGEIMNAFLLRRVRHELQAA